MTEFNRRSALATALLSCATASTLNEAAEAQDEAPTSDEAFVMAAGLTEEEADCWKKAAAAAGAFFKLPVLHPMDRQEVASAIHILQNKLLGRPTYRKYLELAKQARSDE